MTLESLIHIFVFPGLLFVLVISLLYMGIMRKLAARMQNRIGPPIWQPFLDVIKLLSKENIDPENARPGFTLWPIVALASILVVALMIPIAGLAPLATSVDIIVIIYFFALTSLSMFMAGFSSGNPFAVTGSVRGLVQIFSYEFPFVISLIVPLIFLGTLSPIIVNAYQLQAGWLAFSFPISAAVFFICLLAKMEIPPFHVPNAHQEIVGGYHVEYTGSRYAFMEIAHAIKAFVLISLGIAMFFGGSANIWFFLLETFIFLFVLSVIRVIAARVRINQTLKIYWFLGFVVLIELIVRLLI
jgi:NADH-quinone oxidoreductase subunit H